MDTDAITSHISMGPEAKGNVRDKRRDENYVKTKEDAMTCLELECNQTFVGMIQLQYQVGYSESEYQR